MPPPHHRKPEGGSHNQWTHICSRCHKRTYPSRKIARSAARNNHPGERMNSYECPHHAGWWHYGNPNYTREEYREFVARRRKEDHP